MENFNKDLYEKAINDYTDLVTRYQSVLQEQLAKLELTLTDELWHDFTSNSRKGIKQAAQSRLNANEGIYSVAVNPGPVNVILTQIDNLYSLMVNAYGRSSSQAYLISLSACGIDKVINQAALDNLKNHCTTVIDDNVFKAMEAFKKAYNALNILQPNTLYLECNYFAQDNDGNLEVNFYNM